ncbi:arginase, partial [Mesorhizobium sp. M3A.F.Ca.ET.201.01.1.1]
MGRMLVQSIHTAAAVRTARTNNTLPVVCLGTCSGSLGVIGGLNAKENQFGVIWFDAHGDADTPETSRTGFIEGMVTSTIVGRCWSQYTAQTP